jgi:hypothetical protein
VLDALSAIRKRSSADVTRSNRDVYSPEKAIRLTDAQRLDWLRLIRSQNVRPRGIMAQTPQADR